MRKTLLSSVLILLFSLTSLAQQYQVANSGFDSFESDNLNGVGVTPTGWNSSNVKKVVSGITATGEMVREDLNGRTGKCVYIFNTEVGALGITETAPGWVTLGKPWNYIKGIDSKSATAGTDGGINFSARPDTLSVWIKRNYSSTENAHIVFYSWKGTSMGQSYASKSGCTSTDKPHYDEESDIRQGTDANSCGTTTQATQIAEGMWRSTEKFNDWTEIKVPITYLSNDLPEKMNIIVSCANYPNFRDSYNIKNGSQLWADDLKLIYSSAVHEVLLDGMPMKGFNSGKYTYTYPLGSSATNVPEITLKRSKRTLTPSEYTIQKGGLGEETVITVRAEDGSSSTTYRITFVGNVSKNPNPANILIGGEPLKAYNPKVYEYDVELPFGTTSCPEITIEEAEAGQTYTVSKPGSLPGTAVVTVTAPDGTTTQDYTLRLKVGALTDNTLTDIQVNGKTIPGFKPTTNNYTVFLPTGTVGKPTITYTSAYPQHQDIVVDNQGIDGGATISVTPKGTTLTRIYRLKFVVAASTYSYLNSIKIDGKEIDGYNPETTNYSVSLPLGTTSMPRITWEKGDDFQTVAIENGGLNGTTKITVTSEAGNITIYRITFSTAMSDISTLNDIKVNGISVPDFNPATTSYKVELPSGTTALPEITYEKGDEYQTVQVNNGGLNGISRIIVTAQAGNRTTYSIEISVPASSNSTLKDILLDGVSLENFTPTTTDYTIQLPRGTVALPQITWVKGDETQIVDKREGGINGETRITVRAQTGAVTIYKLNFSVVTSGDATLKSITVGGVAIESFEPNTTEYSIELPSGTIELPAIECEKNDPAQIVTITRGDVSGTTVITVRAENGDTRRYTLNFSVAKSENAFLNMIYVDGEEMPEFEPSRLNYSITIPADSKRCPAITVDKAEGQQVAITVPYITGKAVITVTPEFGDKNIYLINIHYPQSDENRLSSITLDGVEIENFSSDIFDYAITLPAGSTSLPEIGYQKMESTQKVYVETNGTDGITRIIVSAENGEVKTYTLNFSTLKSSESTLADIRINGVTIAGFAPEITEYQYFLPEGASAGIEMSYTKSNAGQQVTMTTPEFSGTAEIEVVAEDNSSTTRYTVNIIPTRSSDVTLSEIRINGTPIAEELFVDGIAHIEWNPAYGMPYVTCTPANDRQAIIIADAGYKGTDIIVVAEDGTEYFYSVYLDIVKSSKTELGDILVYDSSVEEYVSLPDFDATVTDYSYTLKWRTETVPAILPVAGDKGQTITISYGKPNSTTAIVVTAEDGISKATYIVNFETEKSSVATLSDILAGGESLSDFEAEKFYYTVTLPYGTTETPVLGWNLGTTLEGVEIYEQTVEYHAAPIGEESSLTVTAEDGTQNVYTVNFEVAKSDKPNTLLAILFGETAVDNITAGKYDYNVTLPYGTTDMPEVSVVKQYDEQSVVVIPGGINGTTVIDVYADDTSVAKTTYNVKVAVDDLNPLSLLTLSVDGTPVPGFNTVDSVYIMNVASVPQSYDYTAQSDLIIADALTFNPSVLNLQVSDIKENKKNYTIYFHYPADVIPNAGFTEWSTTTYNNAQKPTHWTAPADCAEKYKFFMGTTYTTGHEVQNEGNGVVKLVTTGQWNSIAGSVPGMMTIGSMSVDLKAGGNSTSSVSGGITFRNSPDRLTMEYNPISNSNIGNWRLLLTMSDNANSVNSLYTGNYNNKNSWATAELPINYDGLNGVSAMNLTVNSANTENADDLGFTRGNEKTSELHVRNLKFYYNNRLSAITVDGNAVDRFDPAVYNYYYTLDNDYQGSPVIRTTGEVADQKHTIKWVSPTEALITVTAEDGSESEYRVTTVRNKSANNALKSIVINGQQISGFNPETTEYLYTMTADNATISDINIIPSSEHQTVEYRIEGNKAIITVTAENESTRNYTVTFEKEKNNDTSLKNVVLENHPEFVFDNAIDSYSVVLGKEELMPAISFVKNNACQTVDVEYGSSEVILTVKSSDLSAVKNFTISLDRETEATSSILTSLTINYMPLDGFASDKFDYTISANTDEDILACFTAGSVTDTIRQTITDSYIRIAVSGETTNVYTVNIDRIKNSDVALDKLMCNNEMLPDFIPEAIDYTYSHDFRSNLEIRAEVGNNVTLKPRVSVKSGRLAAAMFDAESEDLSAQQTTTVVINNPEDDYALLDNILLGGEALSVSGMNHISSDNFAADTYSYSVTVRSETPKTAQPAIPDITVDKGGDSQTVSIEYGGYESATYITVSAKSGAQQTYVLSFSAETSDNALLADLAVDYRTIEGFSPDRNEYSMALNNGDNEPVITYRKGDIFQNVTVEQTATEITVTVTAEDGTENVYRIALIRPIDDNATLAAIYQDGAEIEGFSPDKNIYGPYDLPLGTTSLPTVTAVAATDGQTVEILEDESGAAIIVTVTASDGVTENEYRILYNIPLSTYNRLSMIYVDGVELEGFDPETLEYTYEMETGRTDYPEITALRGDKYQTIDTRTEEGVTTITVSPQTPDMQAVYTVRCNVNLSDNAYLKQLEANGMIIEGFTPERFDYTVALPSGTTSVPVITWIEGDNWQTVYYKAAADLNGVSKLIVTSQSGENINVYSVRFEVEYSDNTSLRTILLDGMPIEEFASDRYEYDIVLPGGTTEMPEIGWDLGDKAQSVELISGGVNGRTFIVVTAENGDKARYVLNFSVEKSHNSYVKTILLRGKLIDNFDPEIFDYPVTMPYDADDEDVPSIMYELAEPQKQTAEVKVSESLADTTYIKITAEDGETTSTYKIWFEKEKCDISLLADIQIGGEPLRVNAIGFKADKDFDPEEFIYNIELPRGTETLPEITYTGMVEEYSSVEIEGDAVNGQTVIRVTSENEYNVSEYYLNFSVGLSDEARLKSISIKGNELKDFDSNMFQYTITYPIGTDSLSLPVAGEIAYEKLDAASTVTVSQTDKAEIILTVTAENGTTKEVYVLNFEILLSNNTMLKDILINGVSLSGFSPTQYEYTYLLYPGAMLPTLEGVKAEESQTIHVTMGMVNEKSSLFVEAADGSIGEYAVIFKTTDNNPGQQPNMDDVAFIALGDGDFLATSTRTNVKVSLYTADGLRIMNEEVTLIDPNETINYRPTTGTIVHLDKKRQVYIYVFTYNNKVINTGKFVW